MGFFNRGSERLGIYNAANIEADTSYYGECGALRIACDAAENDRVMFEAMIANDFEEIGALEEGAITESELEAIQEANIGGIWAKIKDMVKKIAAKIKGLFQTFITKVNSVIIRDNKKFVEKYKREVLTKDTSKMKYKWSKKKTTLPNAISDATDGINKAIDEVKSASSKDGLLKLDEEISGGDYAKRVLGQVISGTEEETFAKDFHEAWFDDEDEVEGLDNGRKSEIISVLTTKNAVKDVEDVYKKCDSAFSKYLNKIDKLQNEMVKTIPNGAGYSNMDDNSGIDVSVDKAEGKDRRTIGYNNEKSRNDNSSKTIMMNKLALIQRAVSKSQTLYSMIGSAVIKETKFEIAQARRVFAKAASFNPKSIKESAVFEAAAEEAAYYDIMSSFESPEMA